MNHNIQYEYKENLTATAKGQPMKLIIALLVVMFAVYGTSGTPAEALSPCDGGTVNLGTGGNQPYENESPPSNRTWDGTHFNSTAPNAPSSDHALKLGGKTVPAELCVDGPLVNGSFSFNYTWRQMHDDVGGYGLQLFSKLIRVSDSRIDNVEDGVKLQNCAEDASGGDSFCDAQQPGGTFNLDKLYMTAIRDDSIDNDDCMPGDITDSLFDGVYTFLSEQEESSSTGPCRSVGEDTTIGISNDIVRLFPTNAFDPGEDEHHGAGKWFKWQGDTAHHTVVVTNTILALHTQPRSGWDSLDLPGTNGEPGSISFVGNGNKILYLGDDTYGGPRPAGVAFETGAAARATYTAARNRWLTDHGYNSLGSDLNPLDDPVQRHGAK